ncbi:hypothetical protein P3S67_007877 [Capsicum chacoense]
MQSKLMKKEKEVKLENIMDGSLPETQESFYKFKVTILEILNKNEPGFSSCNKCHKIVQVIQDTASCSNCSIENVDYEMRYSLRLEVSDGEQRATVILFEAERFFLGYNVKENIESTSVKKEESKNYRKLVLSKEKLFNFLVRINMNNFKLRRSLIIHEI